MKKKSNNYLIICIIPQKYISNYYISKILQIKDVQLVNIFSCLLNIYPLKKITFYLKIYLLSILFVQKQEQLYGHLNK